MHSCADYLCLTSFKFETEYINRVSNRRFKSNLGRAVIIVNTIEYKHELTVHVLMLIVYTTVAVPGPLHHTLCFKLI